MRLAFVDDDYGEIKKLTTMIDKELQGTVYSSCTKQLFSTGETFLSVWKPGMYDIVFLIFLWISLPVLMLPDRFVKQTHP